MGQFPLGFIASQRWFSPRLRCHCWQPRKASPQSVLVPRTFDVIAVQDSASARRSRPSWPLQGITEIGNCTAVAVCKYHVRSSTVLGEVCERTGTHAQCRTIRGTGHPQLLRMLALFILVLFGFFYGWRNVDLQMAFCHWTQKDEAETSGASSANAMTPALLQRTSMP